MYYEPIHLGGILLGEYCHYVCVGKGCSFLQKTEGGGAQTDKCVLTYITENIMGSSG